MEELQAKIEEYEAEIAEMEAWNAVADCSDTFTRIQVIENKRTIKEYRERIARLQRRIAGTEDEGPSEEYLRLLEYVNSDAYDND